MNRPHITGTLEYGAKSSERIERCGVLAFLDESTFDDQRGLHYVVAAAVVLDAVDLDDDVCTQLRASAATVIGGRQRPFRWSKEGAEKKAALVEVICDHAVCIAAVSAPGESYHQRQSRSRCLVRLSSELAKEGATQLVIESRLGQDVDDEESIREARSSGILPPTFSDPVFGDKSEPLLWLPDAVAGAVRQAEAGKEPRWLNQLYDDGVILGIHRV